MSKLGFMKDALILFAITLVAGACLGGVYTITKEPIAAAQLEARKKAYRTVLSDAADFENAADGYAAAIEKANGELGGLSYGNVAIDECVTGVDASGNLLGYVVTATSGDGYAGDVTVSVGVTSAGEVKGIEFLALSETAGLGMNADKPEWKAQYADKTVDEFTVTKSGASAEGEIDAISGATKTSRAVTGAVNAALYFVRNCLGQ